MTTVSPDARVLWRTVRGPAAILLLIIVAGIGIALVRGGGEGGSLDPRSFDPGGSRALARLLEAQGVRVEFVETLTEADSGVSGATLLITHPDRIRPERLGALGKRAASLVVIAPREDAVAALGVPMRIVGDDAVTNLAPGCPFDAAGVVSLGGIRYEPTGAGIVLCYSGALARFGEITLLGSGAPLTNRALDEQGNAALSMRVLGQHARLVWYVPSLADPLARPEARTLSDLLPAGWTFGLIQSAVAVVVFALWRARRLGPVVTEPLPVVVRAAETVEGRARLYQRAGAADHAAGALRQAARARLVPRLGLPRDASPTAVVTALAARTGRDAERLLYGPPPAGDTELVRLADELDALEQEVRA